MEGAMDFIETIDDIKLSPDDKALLDCVSRWVKIFKNKDATKIIYHISAVEGDVFYDIARNHDASEHIVTMIGMCVAAIERIGCTHRFNISKLFKEAHSTYSDVDSLDGIIKAYMHLLKNSLVGALGLIVDNINCDILEDNHYSFIFSFYIEHCVGELSCLYQLMQMRKIIINKVKNDVSVLLG
jgi:hypothetical protein